MDIVTLSYNYFKSLGYKTHDSFPLLTNDTTLLFTNSTIAPFKQTLLQGENIEKTFLAQKCFRHHYQNMGLFGFQMLGLLGVITEMEEIQDNFLDFLDKIIGIERPRLHVVLNKRDVALAAYCRKKFNNTNIHFCESDHSKYSTVWQFGEGESLSGNGLTIVAESNTIQKCNPKCNIFCECNYYLPLGNFIMVKSPKKEYIEVGFGVESIAASLGNGDYYSLSPYDVIVPDFTAKGFPLSVSKELARYYAGGAILFKEGVTPGNKGADYVLKRMIRKIYESVLYRDIPFAQMELLLQEFIVFPSENAWGDYQGFKKILTAGFSSYLDTMKRGLAELEKIPNDQIKKNKIKLIKFFHETFGIPPFLFERNLKKQ